MKKLGLKFFRPNPICLDMMKNTKGSIVPISQKAGKDETRWEKLSECENLMSTDGLSSTPSAYRLEEIQTNDQLHVTHIKVKLLNN